MASGWSSSADIIISQADDLIGQEGVSGGDLGAGIRPLLQPRGDLGATGRERVLEQARRARPIRPGQRFGQRRADRRSRGGSGPRRSGRSSLVRRQPLQPIDQLQRLARAERIGMDPVERGAQRVGRFRLPRPARRRAADRRAPPPARRSRRAPPPAWRAPPWRARRRAAAGRRAWRRRGRSCGPPARRRPRGEGPDRPSIRARGHGGARARRAARRAGSARDNGWRRGSGSGCGRASPRPPPRRWRGRHRSRCRARPRRG